jgi:hypothetical protein
MVQSLAKAAIAAMAKPIQTVLIARLACKEIPMRRLAFTTLLALTALVPQPGMADGWGSVKHVNATYVPSAVYFDIDTTSAAFTCSTACSSSPTVCSLRYVNSDRDNNKAVFASLLAAFLSSQKVFVSFDQSTCIASGVVIGLP